MIAKPETSLDISARKIWDTCIYTGEQFRTATFTPPTFLLEPWLTTPSYNLLYATRGLGKTYFCMAVALAIANGTSMLEWRAPSPAKVLYVDGEVGGSEMQLRLNQLSNGLPLKYDNLYIISTPDVVCRGMNAPSLTSGLWQKTIVDWLMEHKDVKLIIFDNVSTLFDGVDENSKEEWDGPNRFMKTLRSLGFSTILVHHAGKDADNGPRGTSSREDAVNMSMRLSKIAGHKEEDGCRFKLTWTKSRSIHGDAIMPRTLELVQCDGKHYFEDAGATSTQDAIIEMHLDNHHNREICEVLGKSKSYVSEVITNYKRRRYASNNEFENGELGEFVP